MNIEYDDLLLTLNGVIKRNSTNGSDNPDILQELQMLLTVVSTMLQMYNTPSYERCVTSAGTFINDVLAEAKKISDELSFTSTGGFTLGEN